MTDLKRAKVVFFGTSDFAVPILKALYQHAELVAVVTQPDRPIGRKQEIISTPVKAEAQKMPVKIFQFESLKSEEVVSSLKQTGANLFVVAAYGKIIPQEILDLPKNRTINVHGSILPKYRGASPIHAVLLNGEIETGNTIMIMDAQMDHGPLLASSIVPINSDDDFKTLERKMSDDGARLLIETLEKYLDGKISPVEQDHDAASYTKLISKEDGKIDWDNSPEKIYNQWRAYKYWPGVYSYFTDKNGKKLKLILNKIEKAPGQNDSNPGTIIFNNEQLFMSVGEVAIKVLELTPEGKKSMTASEFINGYRYLDGANLH